jgi:hypothetical protein
MSRSGGTGSSMLDEKMNILFCLSSIKHLESSPAQGGICFKHGNISSTSPAMAGFEAELR